MRTLSQNVTSINTTFYVSRDCSVYRNFSYLYPNINVTENCLRIVCIFYFYTEINKQTSFLLYFNCTSSRNEFIKKVEQFNRRRLEMSRRGNYCIVTSYAHLIKKINGPTHTQHRNYITIIHEQIKWKSNRAPTITVIISNVSVCGGIWNENELRAIVIIAMRNNFFKCCKLNCTTYDFLWPCKCLGWFSLKKMSVIHYLTIFHTNQ